jgi:hypothetical protein
MSASQMLLNTTHKTGLEQEDGEIENVVHKSTKQRNIYDDDVDSYSSPRPAASASRRRGGSSCQSQSHNKSRYHGSRNNPRMVFSDNDHLARSRQIHQTKEEVEVDEFIQGSDRAFVSSVLRLNVSQRQRHSYSS